MGPYRIVEAQITVNANAGIPGCFVFVNINILVLDTTPKPFDKDVVVSPSPVVHADSGTGIEEDLRVFRAGEVASLVAVHDFGNCIF